MLETECDWGEIINEYNDDKEHDKQYQPRTSNNIKFENIKDYKLYIRAAETIPDWGASLSVLVSDLDNIRNVNHSYVLFFKLSTHQFAVTGGNGYQVIEKHKDFSFGINLLSRLISPNDAVIKRINDRYFSGTIIGGNYQYSGVASINSEREFNNFLHEIYLALPSEVIQESLGIKIKDKKKDYMYMVL